MGKTSSLLHAGLKMVCQCFSISYPGPVFVGWMLGQISLFRDWQKGIVLVKFSATVYVAGGSLLENPDGEGPPWCWLTFCIMGPGCASSGFSLVAIIKFPFSYRLRGFYVARIREAVPLRRSSENLSDEQCVCPEWQLGTSEDPRVFVTPWASLPCVQDCWRAFGCWICSAAFLSHTSIENSLGRDGEGA